MEIESIIIELNRLSEAISLGQFDEAMNGADILYQQINKDAERDALFFTIMSNIACIFIDVGHMKPCAESAQRGLDILNEHKNAIIERIGEDANSTEKRSPLLLVSHQ